jgi:hypothetical protein
MEIKSKHSGRLDQYKSDSGGTYVGDRCVGAAAASRLGAATCGCGVHPHTQACLSHSWHACNAGPHSLHQGSHVGA